jgi:hypothetical protein
MDKSKKGYYTLGSSQTVRIRMIRAQPVGTDRLLVLVGDVPNTFYPGESPDASSAAVTGPRMVMVGHGRYNYSVIQLELDEKGNGKGLLYPLCGVVFNEQGRVVVRGVQGAHVQKPNQLVNVHWEK